MKTNASLIALLVSLSTSLAYADDTTETDAIREMNVMKKFVAAYIKEKGALPTRTNDILNEASIISKQEGKTYISYLEQVASERKGNSFGIPYTTRSRRLSGDSYSTPKDKGSHDVILFSDKFFSTKFYDRNPQGFYSVLWDDMTVDLIPYDCSIFSIRPVSNPNSFSVTTGFKGEAGLLENSLSYEEYWLNRRYKYPPIGKPLSQLNIVGDKPIDLDKMNNYDNGIDSLVILSRYISSDYGLNRGELWKVFDPAQTEFTLSEVGEGAKKLNLPVQVAKVSLSDLYKKGTVALLFLQDDGRLVTLTALDDDRAVVIDRGLTKIVERSELEKRYSGTALLPITAVQQVASIRADDLVREIKLSNLSDPLPQQVILRNTGAKPVTVQLEYPILGVTEAKLSAQTIPPGETVTLDVTLKWRTILKLPTQNVLINLHTNDPVVPRLQLAFSLVPHLPPASTK